MPAIYPIVEGHGEERAVPVLFRRVCSEICGRNDIEVLQPHRVPRGRMVAEDATELKRAVELGKRKILQTGMTGAVIVLLDADDDCPADLGPKLLERISRADVAVSVVVANREYEAWFLAGALSLRSHRGVLGDAAVPPSPEAVRGAKQYLEKNIFVQGRVYRETVDQPALSAIVALEEARTAPSFDKLCREVRELLGTTCVP